MVSFLALYRGDSVATAELIAVTNDSDLVCQVASSLLGHKEKPSDPAVAALKSGRARALKVMIGEARSRD
jgi:hypothetical protein